MQKSLSLSACKAQAFLVIAACKLRTPQVLKHDPLGVQAMERKLLTHLLRRKQHLQTAAEMLSSSHPLLPHVCHSLGCPHQRQKCQH
jgi:hypothetical protein